MYECLTGHRPYDSTDTIITLMTDIVNGPAPVLPNTFSK